MNVSGQPPQLPTGVSSNKKTKGSQLPQVVEGTPAAEPADSFPDPLGSVFELLAKNDRKAPKLESNRVRKNLDNGYEALIKLKAENRDDVILSARSEEDVAQYAALLTDYPIEDAALKGLHKDLDQAEKADAQFFLPREKAQLSTDAAGAAVALNRGSRVVVRRADGKAETFNNSKAAQSFLSEKLDPAGVKAFETVKSAKEAGMSLSVHSTPEPAEPGESKFKSKIRMMLENMEASNKPETEFDADLIAAIKERKKLDVSFEEDERPLAVPTTLDQKGLATALEWETSPSDTMTNFNRDFAKLEEDKTLLMARQSSGELQGMVVRADARATYLNLSQGQRVVALDKKGDLHEMKSLADFEKFTKTGRVSEPPAKRFDGEKTDSDNLFMMYHVAPFDPIEKGIFDDLPLRLTEVGSSENVDIVTMRSDLPDKRNLRVDRVQKGELQEIARLDAKTAMSDPKTLEDFVYNTVSKNTGDKKIRMLVGGHGGAEKGLLPDGEHNNAEANHAMPVDDFAGAIKKGLDRVEKETGKRPKIDNLILVSCLMGNTSFIHALAQTGDIDTLIASPELMMGSNPTSTFEYLSKPENSKASGREFAEFLAEEYAKAPSAPGGKADSHHAETVGVYDLSKEKSNHFQKSLNNFFEAALEDPKSTRYIKDAIARTPSYGINPLINVMFDVDNRDLHQVLDRVSKDARIKSPKLQKAVKELKAATLDQVITQKVSEDYEGRKGASLYLPLDRWDFNEGMAKTELLKGTKYKEFMEQIFEAPVQRSIGGAVVNELSRIAESGAMKGLQDVIQGKNKKDKEADKSEKAEDKSETKEAKTDEVETKPAEASEESEGPENELFKEVAEKLKEMAKSVDEAMHGVEARELQDLHDLEIAPSTTVGQKAKSLLRGTIRVGATLAGALVGGAIGAVPIAALGLYRGVKAGITGLSGSGTARPPEEKADDKGAKGDKPVDGKKADSSSEAKADKSVDDKKTGDAKTDKAEGDKKADSKEADGDKSADKDKKADESGDKGEEILKRVLAEADTRVLRQALMAPMEHLALKTNHKVGYSKGVGSGRVAGGLVGAITGPIGGALTGGLAGAIGGGLLAYKISAFLTRFLENKMPEKGPDFFIGWEGENPGQEPEADKTEAEKP